MTPIFTEELRFQYPLTPDSVVVDLGAFRGAFVMEMATRFKCKVFAFEPCKTFYDKLVPAFRWYPAVRFFNYGLAASRQNAILHVNGDASSLYTDCPGHEVSTPEKIVLREAREAFDELQLRHIDLLKINIEGAEYDLLDHLLDMKLLDRVRYLQVQFHLHGGGMIGAEKRREHIRERLLATHDEQWGFPFIWESWVACSWL